MREQHFLFDDGFVNLNHGSLGTYPRSVRAKLREIQDMAEVAPDRFKRYEFPRLLDESRSAMAGFLRVPKEELVFVTDTTTAVDIVLRSLHFQPGDLILYFDTIYGSCEKVIAHVVETTPPDKKAC
ncbi:hypothetical protein GTA08_BOTSDO02011 [Neofusicoccum parvum]|uniref:Uncharacterized protein n=1 Tax=Neofusicoccum parvum TaxID=310453 RepID=A0ACB5SQL9_9PEZI|nr:hypothetical protein GTA08_BOTSDO02011 [Neofusicoccum parvum]